MAAAIASGVLGVASAVGNVVAQTKTANAQTKAINEQRTIVREETRQQASAELFDRMRAGRREQAKIRAASGEAGLSLSSGGSIENLLLDSAMQTEMATDRTIANMESRHRANEADANSMLSRIQKPTAIGAGLQIGSAAVSAWSGVNAAKINKAALSARAG
jgi:F0F1-type ATP synthase membrane subunit c/vacuolar-type H+-ATPase subunit K